MGNTHPGASSTPSKSFKGKLGRQRRLSDPSENQNIKNSHLAPGSSSSSNPHSCTTPPTIQINGKESFDEYEHGQLRAKSASTDFSSLRSTSSNQKNSASERRKIFLSSSTNQDFMARSLDDSMTAKMSCMIRTKSHSPLKQMRTYSFRSIPSEENLIDKESCEIISESWRIVDSRSSSSFPSACFGLFVLRRVLSKIPMLCPLFSLSESDDIFNLPESHPIRRHARLFTNILHISVKNVDELEAQVAPTVFKYGERHYRPDITPHMTEENVRIFCAQIVCTVFDFLRETEATPKCAESWIELMRYLGQKLLDGFDFAKLTAERKISINRNDHHLFLML
uniref:GLOBIN domain-containing protein n=1 Tax=Caenorhabditis tropicalis TaxID=1561998 RepID=A0A1I7V0C2_9PELO